MNPLVSVKTDASWHLAGWAQNATASAIQNMLRRCTGPEFISFALGLPDPRLLPTAACSAAMRWVLGADDQVLQYGPPAEVLKQHIVELMNRRGVMCASKQIFLTSGAQQGLSLLARLFIQRGAPVLVENAIYPGLQQVLTTCEAEVIPVSTHPEIGIDVEYLQSILARGCHPAMLFVNGGAHNPLTVSMGMEQRIRLAELAACYNFPIVEDDAYGLLSYDDSPMPPIYAVDSQTVCYVGSLSKILAPALRVGWIIAPEWVIEKLAIIKESSDLDVATLSQRVAARLFDVIGFDAHLHLLRSTYRERRNKMLEALESKMSEYASWHRPSGGFFIWIRLRDDYDTNLLLQQTVSEEKVAFIPGAAFSLTSSAMLNNCLRLSFSNLPLEFIQEGIYRLSRSLESLRMHAMAVSK